MVIRTFNVDNEVYSAYADYCKANGISMSKRVEKFIAEDIERLKNLHGNQTIVEKPILSKKDDNHVMKKYC